MYESECFFIIGKLKNVIYYVLKKYIGSYWVIVIEFVIAKIKCCGSFVIENLFFYYFKNVNKFNKIKLNLFLV